MQVLLFLNSPWFFSLVQNMYYLVQSAAAGPSPLDKTVPSSFDPENYLLESTRIILTQVINRRNDAANESMVWIYPSLNYLSNFEIPVPVFFLAPLAPRAAFGAPLWKPTEITHHLSYHCDF